MASEVLPDRATELIGLVVLDAVDEEDARKLMEADPSIRSGVQNAELYPSRTFLAREREREH